MSILSNSAAAGQPASLTVRQLIDAYLHLGIDGLAERSVENIRRHLARFGDDFNSRRVNELRAIDARIWLKAQTTLKSGWAQKGVLAVIKRLLNWGLEQELIERNPFARVRIQAPCKPRRAMTDQEFQALLRVADPAFRRFLIFMKFTGARPGELSAMRWKDVRFDQFSVVLEQHKTAAKTGRPRVIPLIPPLVRLLVWIRSHRQASVVGLVERCLISHGGRIRLTALARFMRAYGMSTHATQRARAALRLRKERIGPGDSDPWEYILPDDHVQLPDPQANDFVWLNSLGNAYTRYCLTCKVRQLRRRAGLPESVTLYGLRHRFGITGIKNKVSLKLLSVCMGHTRTQMTDHYIDVAGLTDDVREAALQVAFGPGAVPGAAIALEPRVIPMLTAPPATEIAAIAEHLPAPHGSRPRAQVPLAPTDQPKAPARLEGLLKQLLGRLESAGPPPRRSLPPSLVPPKLDVARQEAWSAYQWALATNQDLAKATDRQVIAWVRAQPNCPHKIPPSSETFRKYLSMARLFHNCRKRILRDRQPAPKPPAEK